MKILEPTDEAIHFAAEALKAGGLVGFPTETVYGIAADATNREAVLDTFRLKRRPAENPLIVHVTSLEMAEPLVLGLSERACRLAKLFWPGPLTMVLPKSALVPDEVTGGRDTVAVRAPRSPEAHAILAGAGRALTAPSANIFMGLSPTRAEHIPPEILGGLACAIDGGPCMVGVESTVLDCTGPVLKVLRPGGISQALIQGMLQEEVAADDAAGQRSPGGYKRHYSPRTPLRLVDRLGPFDSGIGFEAPQNAWQFQLPDDPDAYARALYAALYALDRMVRLELLVELPPDTAEWVAVRDRLRKAANS